MVIGANGLVDRYVSSEERAAFLKGGFDGFRGRLPEYVGGYLDAYQYGLAVGYDQRLALGD